MSATSKVSPHDNTCCCLLRGHWRPLNVQHMEWDHLIRFILCHVFYCLRVYTCTLIYVYVLGVCCSDLTSQTLFHNILCAWPVLTDFFWDPFILCFVYLHMYLTAADEVDTEHTCMSKVVQSDSFITSTFIYLFLSLITDQIIRSQLLLMASNSDKSAASELCNSWSRYSPVYMWSKHCRLLMGQNSHHGVSVLDTQTPTNSGNIF